MGRCIGLRQNEHHHHDIVTSRRLLLLFALLIAACDRSPGLNAEEEHQRRDAELLNSIADAVDIDPQNPFRAAQSLAEDSMGAAIGRNIDQTWVRMMIEHQEGTARFADLMLKSQPSTRVRTAAEKMRNDAHARVMALEALREKSFRTDSTSTYVFAGLLPETFSRMTQVQGTNVSQTWALKVAAYNRGAVSIAGMEATHGQNARVRQLARRFALVLANEADQLDELATTGA